MTVLYTALPLFRASGAILSQMAPSGTTAAALNKCLRQVRSFSCILIMVDRIVKIRYITIRPSAFLNLCCHRMQVRMLDDVMQCYNARFWDLVPGFIVGTLLMQVSLDFLRGICAIIPICWVFTIADHCFFLQVREGADEQKILSTVHSIYNDIGVKDLTVELELYE